MDEPRRRILFAPGAGAPSSSGWMRAMAGRLAELGAVTAFDYPYQLAGRRSPDRAPVLLEAHLAAYAALQRGGTTPLVLAGKSMGSRIGCHVAVAAPVKPAALVCFGYPLVGQNGSLRDAVLLELRTPVLFVQGTRDALCPLERLDAVRSRMSAPHELYLVEDGDHSLTVARRTLAARAETQNAVDERILDAVRRFLDAHA